MANTSTNRERLITQFLFIKEKGSSSDIHIYLNSHGEDVSLVTAKRDIADMKERGLVVEEGAGPATVLRSKPVGVTGSRYRPLDNQFQINEAVEELVESTQRMNSAYNKALISILGIGYIQPFEDGNKRTSRLSGNAILLSHNLAPLSYRSVDEDVYREAMLVFYELNSIIPFKKIFIEQYRFAAENYAL